MLEGLTPVEREIVRQRTVAWVKKARPLLKEDMPNAFKWRLADIECPFLLNGLCSVYERRPIGCRVFYATGNPDDCKMPAREHQQVYNVSSRDIMRLMDGFFFAGQDRIEMDHLGCLLAERLLGGRPQSASQKIAELVYETTI